MALRTIAAGDVRIADSVPFGFRDFSFTHPAAISLHTHGFYEIGITRGGSAEHTAADRTETIKRGFVYILAPGEAHAVTIGRRWDVCNLYYLPDIFAYDLSAMIAQPRMAAIFFYHSLFGAEPLTAFCIPSALFRTVDMLIDALTASSSMFYMKSIFASLCAIIAEAHAAVFPDARTFTADKRVIAVLSAVEHHIGKDTAAMLRAAAEEASVRREYLMPLFQRATGTPLTDYIIRRKIMKSRAMLFSGARITETALSLGFYDTPHFTRTFKAVTGCSPREHMKAHIPSIGKKD